MYSLIIPTYNRDLIAQTLQSAFDPSAPYDAITEVDDGSTDDDESNSILKQFVNRFKTVRITNMSVQHARRTGITAPFQERVTLGDSDDYLGLDYFQFSLAMVRQAPGF